MGTGIAGIFGAAPRKLARSAIRLMSRRPRQDSNLRSRLRRAVLYPLSYGGRSP